MGKRRRAGAALLDLGRESHASMTAIQKLLQAVRNDGIPDHFTTGTQYRERKKFANQMTPHGKLIEVDTITTSKGENVRIGIQNPMPIIAKSLECDGFAKLFQSAVGEYGLRDLWRIILYNDGISPQDSASSHDKRKLISIYWTFREFGVRALSTEEAWFVLATVRVSKLADYDGGLSRFTRECLTKHFFSTTGGNNFKTTGMASALGVLRASLWLVVADEPALKDFFLNKGHSGLFPCVLCANVVLHRLYDAAVHARFVTTACTDVSQFKYHTDASIRTLYHELQRQHGVVNDDEFGEMELACGFNYSDYSLILDPNVGIASQVMYDYPHIYGVGGLVDKELGVCMRALRGIRRCGINYAVLGEFIARWCFPKHLSPNLERLFDEAAAESHYSASAFKSTTSDLITLTPVLSFFFVHVALPLGFLTPQVRSLIAAFDVLMLLMCVRHECVTPESLRDAVLRHLVLFKAAYGEESFVPKHHYATHLWRMLRHFGILISCLTLERLHKVPKRYVKDRRNTQSYEVGTIEDVTIKQLYDRREDWMAVNRLISPHSPPLRTTIGRFLEELYPDKNVNVANRVCTLCGQVTVGDVVFYRVGADRHCGEVHLHLSVGGGAAISIIDQWELAPIIGPINPGCDAARYKIVSNARQYPTDCILTPLTYSKADGFATVLVPPLFR